MFAFWKERYKLKRRNPRRHTAFKETIRDSITPQLSDEKLRVSVWASVRVWLWEEEEAVGVGRADLLTTQALHGTEARPGAFLSSAKKNHTNLSTVLPCATAYWATDVKSSKDKRAKTNALCNITQGNCRIPYQSVPNVYPSMSQAGIEITHNSHTAG